MENKCLCKHSNSCGSIKYNEGSFYRYVKPSNSIPKYVVFDDNDTPLTFTEMVFKSLFETNKSILRDKNINQILK